MNSYSLTQYPPPPSASGCFPSDLINGFFHHHHHLLFSALFAAQQIKYQTDYNKIIPGVGVEGGGGGGWVGGESESGRTLQITNLIIVITRMQFKALKHPPPQDTYFVNKIKLYFACHQEQQKEEEKRRWMLWLYDFICTLKRIRTRTWIYLMRI